MFEIFVSYFEGYFNNQRQAFQYPREFALIELNHNQISDNRFRVKQRYIYEIEPYRETIIEFSLEDNNIIAKNFKESEEGLTYLKGCDTIFEWDGNQFHGKNACNECFVHRAGRDTYLVTESFLGNGYYNVIDKGMDISTNEHVWGSFNGFFEFDRK